jgi:hypothetical protein
VSLSEGAVCQDCAIAHRITRLLADIFEQSCELVMSTMAERWQ